jgi:hypothetical protein
VKTIDVYTVDLPIPKLAEIRFYREGPNRDERRKVSTLAMAEDEAFAANRQARSCADLQSRELNVAVELRFQQADCLAPQPPLDQVVTRPPIAGIARDQRGHQHDQQHL